MNDAFFTKLDSRVGSSSTILCIGLDPHIGQLENKSAEGAYNFCVNIVNETHEYAACFKPNIAFFEQFGPEGYEALQRVIKAIPVGIPVLLDCKRGDIDTTAQAYASSAYEALSANAVTLSPYMGWDSVKPFVTDRYGHKGAFILCKTSNPSSNQLQMEKLADGSFLYEKVAGLCTEWNATNQATNNGQDCVGVVAGATDLEALRRIRSLCPSLWILCPGVGAQGGDAESVCRVGLRLDGSGLLLSVSRGVSSQAQHGVGAMAAEARRLRDESNVLREACVQQVLGQAVDVVCSAVTDTISTALGLPVPIHIGTTDSPAVAAGEKEKEEKEESIRVSSERGLKPYQRDFIAFAMAREVLSFGQFTLKSGRLSPYFFNVGRFCTGACMSFLARCYAQAIHDSGVEFDVLFGPAYKGIPLATAVGMAYSDMFGRDVEVSYNRKEVKDHGEGGQLVGASVVGRRVLIVDDVITAGTAIREAVELLRAQGAAVVAVSVCLDRQEKTSEASSLSAIQEVECEFSIPVVSIVRLAHLIEYVKTSSSSASVSVSVEEIERYRAQFGVEY